MRLVWKDRKPISFLSFFHSSNDGDKVERNTRTAAGGHQTIEVNFPVLVNDYNKFMGGVDKNDQLSKVRKEQKQLKWYFRPVIKSIQLAAYNAYVIEERGNVRQHRSARGKVIRHVLDFKELVRDMIGNVRTPPDSLKRRRSFGAAAAHEQHRLNIVGVHSPEKGEGHNHTCMVCHEKIKRWLRANDEDRPCPYGSQAPKTTFRCMECQEYFCITKERNCFVDFHTKVEYWR